MKSGTQSSTTLRAHRFPVSRTVSPGARGVALVPLPTGIVSPTLKGSSSFNDFHRVISPSGTGLSMGSFPSGVAPAMSSAESLGVKSSTTSPTTAVGGYFPSARTVSQYSVHRQHSAAHFTNSPSGVLAGGGMLNEGTGLYKVPVGGSHTFARRMLYSPSGVMGSSPPYTSSPAGSSGSALGSQASGVGTALLASAVTTSFDTRARSPLDSNADALITVVAPGTGASVVRDQQEAMWRAAEAEENANTDRVQVKVEGFFEQDEMGGLIPSEMPRSRVLYVLTASEGRDMIFKTMQYSLLVVICLLKRPSLFSPDAIAFLDMWALRFWNNYNTIRHGRSLFKLGSWILNLFQAQMAVERLTLVHKRLLLRLLRTFMRVFCLPIARKLGIHISRRFYYTEAEEEEDLRLRKLYYAAFGQLSTPVIFGGSGASHQPKHFPASAPPGTVDYPEKFRSSIVSETVAEEPLENNDNNDGSTLYPESSKGVSFPVPNSVDEFSRVSILNRRSPIDGADQSGVAPQDEKKIHEHRNSNHHHHYPDSLSTSSKYLGSEVGESTEGIGRNKLESRTCSSSSAQQPTEEATSLRDTLHQGFPKKENVVEGKKHQWFRNLFFKKDPETSPSLTQQKRRKRSSVSEVDDMLLGGVYAYVSEVERPSGLFQGSWKTTTTSRTDGIREASSSSAGPPYPEKSECSHSSPEVSSSPKKNVELHSFASGSAPPFRVHAVNDKQEESMKRLNYADVGGDEVQLLAGDDKTKPSCISDSDRPSSSRKPFYYDAVKRETPPVETRRALKEEDQGITSTNTTVAQKRGQSLSAESGQKDERSEDIVKLAVKEKQAREDHTLAYTATTARTTSTVDNHANNSNSNDNDDKTDQKIDSRELTLSSVPSTLPSDRPTLLSNVGSTVVVQPPPPHTLMSNISPSPEVPTSGDGGRENSGEAVPSHYLDAFHGGGDDDTLSLSGSFEGTEEGADAVETRVTGPGPRSFRKTTMAMNSSDSADHHHEHQVEFKKEASLSDVLHTVRNRNGFTSHEDEVDSIDTSPLIGEKSPSAWYLEETLPPSVRRPPRQGRKGRNRSPRALSSEQNDPALITHCETEESVEQAHPGEEEGQRIQRAESATQQWNKSKGKDHDTKEEEEADSSSPPSKVLDSKESSSGSTEDEDEALLFRQTKIGALALPSQHVNEASTNPLTGPMLGMNSEPNVVVPTAATSSASSSLARLPPSSGEAEGWSGSPFPCHTRRPKPRPAPILDEGFVPTPFPPLVDDWEEIKWPPIQSTIIDCANPPAADKLTERNVPHPHHRSAGDSIPSSTSGSSNLPGGGGSLYKNKRSNNVDKTNSDNILTPRPDALLNSKRFDVGERLSAEAVTAAVLEASRRQDGSFGVRKNTNDPLKDERQPGEHNNTAEEAALGGSQGRSATDRPLPSFGLLPYGNTDPSAPLRATTLDASLPSFPPSTPKEESNGRFASSTGRHRGDKEENLMDASSRFSITSLSPSASSTSLSSSTSDLRRVTCPASAALPAQCRQSPLQFRKALMILFLCRCLAATIRHFLRDVTLLSSERFFLLPRVERHRRRLHNTINIFWFISATVDLILSTTRVCRKGWLRYASSRQNIYCRCACKRMEDPADFTCRVQGMVARRKTDLFFPSLDLDYGAPATSNIGFFEAADPSTMRPACSRCGCIYDIPVQHVYASENPARVVADNESSRSKSAAAAAAAAIAEAVAIERSLSGDSLPAVSATKTFTSVDAITSPIRPVHPLPHHVTGVISSSTTKRRTPTVGIGLVPSSSQGGTPKLSSKSSQQYFDKQVGGKLLSSGRQTSSVVKVFSSAGLDSTSGDKKDGSDSPARGSAGSNASVVVEIEELGVEGAVPHSHKKKTNVEEDGGLLLVPWVMRRLFNYAWLTVVHENFSWTLLMHLNYMAQWYLAFHYTFGNFESHRRDTPLKDVLHLDGAVAGLTSALVGLFRVIKGAPS